MIKKLCDDCCPSGYFQQIVQNKINEIVSVLNKITEVKDGDSGWNIAKDCLPQKEIEDVSVDVLVIKSFEKDGLLKFSQIDVGYFDYETNCWCCHDEFVQDPVTHWKEIDFDLLPKQLKKNCEAKS